MEIGEKFLIFEFNTLCEKNQIRCLRNNIYETIHIKNFNDLEHAWRTHPTVDNSNKDIKVLLKTIKFVLNYQKRSKFKSTCERLFWIIVNMSEKEIINFLLKSNLTKN